MERGIYKHSKLPTRFVRVGEVLHRYGKDLICEIRPGSMLMLPCEACEGCWFKNSRDGSSVINCNDLQCSSFDRVEGKNVWFRALRKPRGATKPQAEE